ncbi:MAG: TIGR00266 family protein [Gemmataceae bacterium]
MPADELSYSIQGDDIQLVEIELDPGETVIAEAGVMNYMEADIVFHAKMGDGSKPDQGFLGKMMQVGKRAFTGESLFMTHFTNEGRKARKVGFAAPYPGRIIPMDLDDFDGEILCEKGAFLCAAFGTEIGIAFKKKLGVGLFGGEGFILQRLKGDGMVFIHAGGSIIRRDLEEGEVLRLDTGCLVAMTRDVEYGIERAGNLKSMFLGGEGLFLATLEGPGTVWIQTLPFSRLADRIIAASGGGGKGEGSVLGGVGRLLGGN